MEKAWGEKGLAAGWRLTGALGLEKALRLSWVMQLHSHFCFESQERKRERSWRRQAQEVWPWTPCVDPSSFRAPPGTLSRRTFVILPSSFPLPWSPQCHIKPHSHLGYSPVVPALLQWRCLGLGCQRDYLTYVFIGMSRESQMFQVVIAADLWFLINPVGSQSNVCHHI